MDLKTLAYQAILISSLFCSSFGNFDVSLHLYPSTYSSDINWDNITEVDESQLVAAIPHTNIKLYYVKEDKDYADYIGFILQTDSGRKFYKWTNVTNPSYAPKLELYDLNRDGKEEIIVHLCKGYGTGIYDEEIHVVTQSSFPDDIYIEDPIIVAYKNAKAREFPEHFEITLYNKKFIVNKKGIMTPPYSNVGVSWGEGNTQYEVKNNTLYAKVRVSAGMINIGELVVKYKYQDRVLQMDCIGFNSYKK